MIENYTKTAFNCKQTCDIIFKNNYKKENIKKFIENKKYFSSNSNIDRKLIRTYKARLNN